MSKEILDLVEKQGAAWEEFKKANDERIAAIEAKTRTPFEVPAEVKEKMVKTEADLNLFSKQLEEIAKAQKLAAISASVGNEGKARTPEQVEYKNALLNFIRTGDSAKLDSLQPMQRKAMNMGDDPSGGYLVDEEMDATIDRFAQVISALPGLARVVTIGSPEWEKLVKISGMAMRRVAEGATGGETTEPKYASIKIPVYEAEVEPWVYNATLADSRVNLEADLTMEAGIGFAEGMAAEYISGNGVGKARGITAYPVVANANYAWGKVGYIASGKAATFASVAPSDKIISLQHALKAQYRPGASFLMADSTLGVARQMKDGSGVYYLWQPDVSVGFGGRFLGSPVYIDDNMAALASNAYGIAYGNWQRAYAIVNRAGTSLIRDNITAKGTTKFNFRRRTGGGVYNFEAFKLMKFAAS
jgi:HK97 family phage major capsid protein